MDDELQLLEAELKALTPVEPSRQLTARLQRELAPPVRRPAPLFWLWAGALPAAAALALSIGTVMRRDLSPVAPADRAAARGAEGRGGFKPVAAENVLYAARDEGLVTLKDGTTARRERLSYVDTITFKNPLTNASLKWSVPREEVRVVPVSFQ